MKACRESRLYFVKANWTRKPWLHVQVPGTLDGWWGGSIDVNLFSLPS